MQLHHLALRTNDVERCVAFYRDVLGVPERTRNYEQGSSTPRSIWMQSGGVVIMVERSGEEEPPIPPGSRELIAFSLDPGTLAEWRSRLGEADVPIEWDTPYTLYFRDPDGRRIAVSEYMFDGPDRG